jgi:hypothetical protein
LLAAISSLVLVFAAMQDRTGWPEDGRGNVLWVVEEAGSDSGPRALGILSLHAAGAAVVFVPADLSVKRRDGRLTELGDLGEDEGWSTCCDAVGSLLGLPVAGYVALTEREAVALIDAMGPVRIAVPAAVTHPASSGAGAGIDIGRGEHALSGVEILAYVNGEAEDSAGKRRERALQALMTTAGVVEDKASAAARRLLSRARSNLDMGSVWDSIRRTEQSGKTVEVVEIPTTVLVRDGVARRVVQVVEAEKAVASAIGARALLTPEDITVAIFNGSGARLAATRAALYLQERGFRVGRIGNADDFGYVATYVVRLTEEPKAWILRDALPGAAKVVSPGEFGSHYDALRPSIPQGADVVLVVGAGMEFGR